VVSLNRGFLDIWEIRAEDGEVDPVQAAIDGPDRFLAQSILRVKDAEGFLNRIRELYADPTASDQCEIELLDGRTLERYSAGVLGKAGSYLGRVWFFRDISERKIAHERLQNAYKTVETLAATDALTGLANRRRFEEVLNNEWRRGLRDRRPLALLMIDADRFKLYNDTYGHPRGDNCLKQIAEAAQDVVGRPGDLVARYGGEEFAVILPNTDSEGAMLVANEICRAMRMRQLPHSGGPSGIVTVSVGCSVIVPAFGRHAANLVELADAALYEAKHRGRNQACDSSEALSDREGKTLGLIPSEKHA
jgi:diguanylate cyclase (GGDEF)-like protein